MPRKIDYYFSMSSPWTYLGHDTLIDLANRHNVAIVFHPLPLPRLFDATGGLPLARRHAVRQRYRMIELQRWGERRGIKLNLQPKHFPFGASLVDRLVIALSESGQNPDKFMRRAFTAIWTEDRDLADPSVIAELAGPAASLLDTANAPEVIALYEKNLETAQAEGVFGAPSYILDGELFWGQDRLDLLDAMLTEGRPPYRAG